MKKGRARTPLTSLFAAMLTGLRFASEHVCHPPIRTHAAIVGHAAMRGMHQAQNLI